MSVREVDAVVEELCGDLGTIRAPRGQTLNARSWQTEAPLRMLLNNLDREVAEKPQELIVYGGSGKAARNHDALKALVRSLLALGEDETLLVQSGKPVGVFRTHPGAPRVPAMVDVALTLALLAAFVSIAFVTSGRGAEAVASEAADDR